MRRFIGVYILTFSISLFIGRYLFSPLDMSDLEWTILLYVRLPRIVAASLIGTALSLAGLSFQNTFRNYLAGPNILGVTSGAGFGAVLAILVFSFNPYLIQTLAFVFGLLAVLTAWKLGKLVENGILGLILAGIAVSAFFSALIGLAKYMADPYDKLPTIVFWLLGSLSGLRWSDIEFFGIPMLTSIIILILLRWPMNLLSLREEDAFGLGFNVSFYRKIVIGFSALGVSAATAIAGMISWIGLVSPHIARLLVGYDNRKLAIASAFTGATLLVICDDLARTLVPSELPLGVITSLVSAPILMIILARRRLNARD